ncbi:MAG: DUF1887 family protein, partial [Proteobacteria bacterium]|nr:DUF1887 family protein [Pseudomonadota bacterium]
GKRTGVPSNLRDLTQQLVKHAEVLAKSLAAINWLAQQAERDLKSPTLSIAQQNWHELQVLIGQFAEVGLLEYKQDCLYFKDEAARFFVNGGWLEVYTYGLLYGLRSEIPKIQDVGRSIELSRDSTGKAVKNELDVAFLHNNHLYIIECKTKRFINTNHEQGDSHAADALYKLDTLKWLFGGIHTKVMLVSYQPLSSWDKQRAKDLKIATCTDNQLVQLETTLKRWMNN